MTTLEQIRQVKNVLTSNQSFKSADSISTATGTSYNFMRALIESGMVSKVNGRYRWTHEGTPNVRTYNKLRDKVRQHIAGSVPQQKETETTLTFGNNVKVVITNGSAVISKNGVRIKVEDLANLEKLLKLAQ